MGNIPTEYRRDYFEIRKILRGIKEGRHENWEYSKTLVLRQHGYIKPKWKHRPYIDNPSKMAKVFDRYMLTEKGKKFLRGLNKLNLG